MNKKQFHHVQKGWILIAVILALTLLGIVVPALISLIQKESKDSHQLNVKTKSFQLAEAGQDRAAWKLRESDAIWTSAAAGTPLTNYNNDKEFADIQGGTYKIQITAGPASGEVTVISKGKATGTTDVRAIRAVYSKGAILGAMSVVGGIDYKPNLNVEWGPVVTYTSIDQEPANRWPRKYSAGQIVGYDTSNDSNNGAMPSENWSTYDYAAFYSLGTAPSVDLNAYRNLAKSSIVPVLKKKTGTTAAAHNMIGVNDSGYYTEDVNIEPPGSGSADYTFTCSTCVIFIEGAISQFPSDAWLNVRAILCTGDADFNADSTTYVADIPSNAHDEYEYDPLSNLAAGTGTKHWNDKGWTNGGTYSVSSCGMHGLLYVGGNLTNAGGGAIMVGAVFVVGSVSLNTMTVYYDSAVANDILFSNATISRQSWDEIRTSW